MRFPELGIYLLPGHSDRPSDLLDEVRAAGFFLEISSEKDSLAERAVWCEPRLWCAERAHRWWPRSGGAGIGQ